MFSQGDSGGPLFCNLPGETESTVIGVVSVRKMGECKYSQACVQRPPLGPEKCGRLAEGYMKKISCK